MADPITLRDDPLESPAFPEIARIQELSKGDRNNGQPVHAATLHCYPFTSRFTWKSGPMDARIQEDSLVSIAWNTSGVNSSGLEVARLIYMDRPEKRINLFETVPKTWMDNQPLLERAGRLWAVLPFQFQHLFNAIFWDPGRFRRYVTGPSSLRHHHSRPQGNLEHTVQVTEIALGMARQIPRVSLPVLILAGLLHDAGKAEEYRFDREGNAYRMSDQGNLIGHKIVAYGWVQAAMAQHRIFLPKVERLALEHALTATQGIQNWTGFRPTQTLEAEILSAADRVSSYADMLFQLAPEGLGAGGTHESFRGRPFLAVPEVALQSENEEHFLPRDAGNGFPTDG